jgi:hypothetical protein
MLDLDPDQQSHGILSKFASNQTSITSYRQGTGQNWKTQAIEISQTLH